MASIENTSGPRSVPRFFSVSKTAVVASNLALWAAVLMLARLLLG